MGQITSGLRVVLNSPFVYSLFQTLVGGTGGRKRFVHDYLRPQSGNLVLEIGCGPGEYSESFSDEIKYTGFDLSQSYIDFAKRKYSFRKNIQFFCADVSEFTMTDSGQFDICFTAGVLHHLNDEECNTVFSMAHGALKKGGRFISIDPAFAKGQSRIAKYIISKDRGQNVRDPTAYEKLARSVFENVKTSVHHNLLRIPYTHIIMECSR